MGNLKLFAILKVILEMMIEAGIDVATCRTRRRHGTTL